jgi:hypothetical protein
MAMMSASPLAISTAQGCRVPIRIEGGHWRCYGRQVPGHLQPIQVIRDADVKEVLRRRLWREYS